MSKLNDVMAAIEDFRAELFTEQHSEGGILSAAAASAGLRGVLGRIVSPLQNIHATGVGIRRKKGQLFPSEFVIKVYVFHKLEGLGKLVPKILSKAFQGVELDIEELPVMEVRAKRAARQSAEAGPVANQQRKRPIVGGLEIQPQGASFVGTLGGFVKPISGTSGVVFALSNNHVLANTNQVPIGKEITQPFSSQAADVFARLTAFETISLASPSTPVAPRNRIDAAIARVTNLSLIKLGTMFGIPSYVPQLKAALPGMSVTKSGRTTGVTTGRITATRVNGVLVNYGTPTAPLLGTFDGCVQVVGDNNRPFSNGGDSGSFILDRTSGRPVALLFAGNGATTTANDLTAVCTRFGVLPA